MPLAGNMTKTLWPWGLGVGNSPQNMSNTTKASGVGLNQSGFSFLNLLISTVVSSARSMSYFRPRRKRIKLASVRSSNRSFFDEREGGESEAIGSERLVAAHFKGTSDAHLLVGQLEDALAELHQGGGPDLRCLAQITFGDLRQVRWQIQRVGVGANHREFHHVRAEHVVVSGSFLHLSLRQFEVRSHDRIREIARTTRRAKK